MTSTTVVSPEADAPASGAAGRERRRQVIRASALRSLRRRRLFSRTWIGLSAAALVVSLVPLVALVAYAVDRGARALSVDFFIHTPTPPGVPGGGVADAIVGTLVILACGIVMAVPVGLVVSLFLIGRRGPVAAAIRFSANVMAGIPSIAIGIFAYSIVVRPMHHFSAIAGSFALAVLMLPIVVRADEEAMATVPHDLREAGLALGVRRFRVMRSVVLRGALPGIATGNLLAMARAVGETAPLLFVIGGGAFDSHVSWNPLQVTSAMPIDIYENGISAFAAQQQTAWATAFVLLVLVLILSVAARLVAARLTRRAR